MAKQAYFVHEPEAGPLSGTLVVLWHGAGGDVDQQHIRALAKALPARGATVVRARFRYRVAGKRAPDRMPKLIESAKERLAQLEGKLGKFERVVLGGRSMGGRMTTMLAAEGFPVDGLILLSYPLHPAGKKDKLRDAHLPEVKAPMLFVQGSKDALCDLELLRPVLAKLPKKRVTLDVFDGGDHGMRRIPEEDITAAVVRWIEKL